jgi:regulator of replication initiation timing
VENSIIEDVVVGVVCGLIAVPLCEASWHAIVVESEIARGIAGLAFGIPIGVFGFTFHWWKGKLQRVADAAVYWWPIAIVLAFGYVAGPVIYQRATQPILQSQLESALKERDALKKENENLRKHPSQTPPPSAPAPAAPNVLEPSQPQFRDYRLSDDQIQQLADELFFIKNELPTSIKIQRVLSDTDSINLGFQVAKFLERASIKHTLDYGSPITPQDKGISLRVGDIQSIPDAEKKVAKFFKKVIGVEPPFTTLKGDSSDSFAIFVGPKP